MKLKVHYLPQCGLRPEGSVSRLLEHMRNLNLASKFARR